MNNKTKPIQDRLEKAILILLVLTSFSSSIFAFSEKTNTTDADLISQQKTITGTVKDATGFPLAGANVIEKGTSNGAQTDFDGNFSLNVSNNAVLVISFIGYVTKEIPVGNKTNIQVVLEEDVATLDEVVVVGYGTQKKVNLTGSVQTVSFKEEVNQPVTNSGQLLYGRFSGVQLSQTSGNPGADGSSIVIRGVGTFGNTTPLVVIDNIQYDDLAAFNSLAPADIESVTVLKDASASAIYGARGANGVILVTTRKGTKDKFEVSYNGFYGLQNATVKPEFLGSLDYANLINEKFRNEDGPGFLPRYTEDQLEAIRTGSLPDQFANTDWADEVLRTASIQNHNFAFSGGNEKTTYRLSLGFLGQDAIIRSKFKNERYNFNLNINSKLKEWLTLSSVTNSFWRRIEGPTGGQNAFSGDNGIIYSFQRAAPTIPLFYSYGQYGVVDGAWENGNASFLTQNPLRRGYFGTFESDNINISQRLGATFQFTEYLSFETSGSVNLEFSNVTDFSPRATLYDYTGVTPIIVDQTNRLESSSGFNYTLLNENILRFNKTFNDIHDVSVLVGHAVLYERPDNLRVIVENLPTDNLFEPNAGLAENTTGFGGAGFNEVTQSFFTRLNYNFKGKYLAEFNLRRDGSSKFGPQNIYGNFPSASIGWNISREKFLADSKTINNLKLRASWGISGNDRIGNGIAIQTYNTDQDYVLGAGSVEEAILIGAAITSIANPSIRWEETEQYNIGLDLGLFRNKVEIIADYFNRDSQDILYTNFPIPNTLGVGSLGAQNAASMINRGLELGVNYRGNIGEAKFSIGGNLTKFLKNEVTGLGDGGEETITNINIIRIGQPFRSYYGLQAIGVFQSLEEIANAPDQYDNPLTAPGDLRYADVNQDGVVDDDDRTIIGNPNPDLLVNFNGSLEFKGFDFNFLLQGVSGVDRLLMGNGNLPMADNRSNVLRYWINRWTPENPSINLPRVGGQNNTRVSSFYVQDASYLRLKNIELGYSLPKDVLKKFGVNKLRVFMGAQNLLTFTGLEYFDPEGGAGNQSNRNAPLYKTVTFGINLKL